MVVSESETTLLNIKNSFNEINQQVAYKKKTTKWRACKTICDMFYSRVNATLAIHQSGGSGTDVAVIGDSLIYNSIYKDVIDYWKGELLK